jgi:hypothetical protein
MTTHDAPRSGGAHARSRSIAASERSPGSSQSTSASSQSKSGVQIGFAPEGKLMYESVPRIAGKLASEYAMRRRW